MNYQEQFSKRAASYFSAMSKYPNAMSEEFKTAIDSLCLLGGETVVNIPAGCVNLDTFLDSSIRYLPFEIDTQFAKRVNQDVCSLNQIPCETSSVDRVISVAGLHHASEEERRLFYKEVKRILKPDGLFVVADVKRGSKQDEWLNGFVNTHNSCGHKGIFWSQDDIPLLEEAGFSVHLSEPSYRWKFQNRKEMIDFSKDLFYLDKANQEDIEKGVTEILQADETTIPWGLLYFVCKLRP